MPPPRRCYEPRNSLRLIAASIFREGSRPSGCPRPMRRGWLRRNRLNRTSGTFMGARRFSALCRFLPISMVKSRSGGLGYSNAKTARRAFQILRLLGPRGTSPKPPAKLRNSPGNSVRISGGNIVTRYSKRGNHFTGAHGMLVHQDYDSAVPFLWAEAFGDEEDGRVPAHVLEDHRRDTQEVGQVGGKAIQLWQFRLVVARFRAAARDRVSDRYFARCQVAHQAQAAEAAAEVPAEVQDQPVAGRQLRHRCVNGPRHVQPHLSRKNADLEVAHTVRHARPRDGLEFRIGLFARARLRNVTLNAISSAPLRSAKST